MNSMVSPLLPQVKQILINQGYRPVEGSQLFKKESPSALGDFMIVTQNGVRPYGSLSSQEESHMQFVTRNTRHLFGNRI